MTSPQFLSFGGDNNNSSSSSSTALPVKEEEERASGPLARLLVSCVTVLPLHTPAYAGLLLAIDQNVPSPEYAGFAQRSVRMALLQASLDLDSLLLSSSNTSMDRALAFSRLVHIMRWLGLLGKMGVVQVGNAEETDVSIDSITEGTSLLGLWKFMVTVSVRLAPSHASVVVASAVLSSVLYALDVVGRDTVQSEIVSPLEPVLQEYNSTYRPGKGSTALLLSKEQADAATEEDDEEDDDDDDEAEEGAGGQRCDSLHDLLRAVKSACGSSSTTRYTVVTDEPWAGLQRKPSGEAEETEGESITEGESMETRLEYTGEAISLVVQECEALTYAWNGDISRIRCAGLEGIVFGRLPIFGPPAEEVGDDDEEEDEEDDDMEQDATAPNEQLQAYKTGFGTLDRSLISYAIRDCLLHHKSSVSDTGLERGSPKDAAERVWAITKRISGDDDKGIEYAIIETLLSLIVEASASSCFGHLYLSRVVVELTRLQPSVMPQALVAGVAVLLEDYLPSLVPTARDNLSKWFSFHLLNTDFQWPTGYWEHWARHVTGGDNRTVRGEFVTRTLELLTANMSSVALLENVLPETVVKLLPLLLKEPGQGVVAESVYADVAGRISSGEEPDSVASFIRSDEIAESYSAADPSSDAWWRTVLVARALLAPAQTKRRLEEWALAREEDTMDQDEDPGDVLTKVTDCFVRYKSVLSAALECDANGSDDEDVLLVGQARLLQQTEMMASHSRVVLTECIAFLLRNEIVTGMAVIRWILGDYEGGQDRVVPRWYDMGELTLRIITSMESESLISMDYTGDSQEMSDENP